MQFRCRSGAGNDAPPHAQAIAFYLVLTATQQSSVRIFGITRRSP
ncbi:hypothetical protein [Nostoc sp. MS1]|nr:hypothetical protein [Nostoc sp. MS1]